MKYSITTATLLSLAACCQSGIWAQNVMAAPANATSSACVESQCWVEELARGLKYPFSLVWLPNGEALIAERQGGLRVFRNDRLEPEPLSGVPASYQNAFNGIKGVLL